MDELRDRFIKAETHLEITKEKIDKLEKDYNQMKAEVEYQNIKSTALQEDIEALNLEIKDLKKQAREKVCSLRESLLQFIDDIVERVKGAK